MALAWLGRVLKLLAGQAAVLVSLHVNMTLFLEESLELDIALPLRIKGRLAEYDSHDCKV